MRDQFIKTLTGMVQQDDRLMLITGDLGFGVLTSFAKEFPKSFLNAGVAEQNMTLMATGLALGGRTVFTYSIANFPIFRCYEMIRNDACYHDANVKVVSIGGGFSYGSLGISHHATEDIAAMRALPNITVVVPSDLWEVEMATKAIAALPGTVYFRLDKDKAPSTADAESDFEIGKARQLRNGDALTVISAGGIMREVLSAVDQLKKEGVKVRVLSMHTIKPIDRDAIVAAARETGGILTVEEHSVDGGLGSAVGEVLLDEELMPKRFKRMGLTAGFSSIVGSQEYLRKQYGLDESAILQTLRRMLEGSS